MNTSKTLRTAFVLAATSLLSLCAASAAAIAITDDGLNIDGKYIYDVTFSETTPANLSSLLHDMADYSNIEAGVTGSGSGERHFLRATGGKESAWFIYEFDLSGLTAHSATSLYIQDVIYLNDAGTITTSYRLGDSGDWTVLNTTTTKRQVASHTDPEITIAPSTTKIFYKVEFTSAVGSTFSANNFQWNRSAPTATNTFSVILTTTPIPEPANAALLILAGCVVAASIIKHRKS
ncbi:hypothetical protein [Geminisphaera colitermitum]|uniref:hypothetical protein n=1 Tax=Geminisphaera colitermitum TaxID=1148786 RepID=UPI000158CEDB|nr:hypothetical protein [Geminisphaera colitermitum]